MSIKFTFFDKVLPISLGNRCNHDCTYGRHPSSFGGTYTIPQRLTVAGDATAKSWTSNNILIVPGISIPEKPTVSSKLAHGIEKRKIV